MMHCMAAAHIGFACAADKWMSIDGQLIIYTRVKRAILCVVHSSKGQHKTCFVGREFCFA